MILKTKQFILRPLKNSDDLSIVNHADNPKIAKNLTDTFPHPYTIRDARSWIRKQKNSKMNFGIVINGEVVGSIGMSIGKDQKQKTATFGYWLSEKYWGQGIISSAVKIFSKYAFDNFDIDRLEALVYLWNPASRRILEKNGFKYEGTLRKSDYKNGRSVDELMFSKIRK